MRDTADLPTPPRRALAFARAVTRRHALHAAARVHPVDRVLREPLRPLLRYDNRHFASATAVQFRFALRSHTLHTRQIEPSHPVWLAGERGQRGHDGTSAVIGSAPRTRVDRPRVPAADRVQLARQTRFTPPALTLRVPAITPGARRATAPAIPLVHRAGSTAAGPTQPHAAPQSATPYGISWTQQSAVAAASVPALTAADVPAVVDQVVREIDRRVVASRERRGWTS